MTPANAADALRCLRDPRQERSETQRLRALPEGEAFVEVQRLTEIDPEIGLRIACKVLQRRCRFEQLLREGLLRSNESTVRFWLEGVADRLGASRVVRIVKEQLIEHPAAAERALYWLPRLVAGDERAQRECERLMKGTADKPLRG